MGRAGTASARRDRSVPLPMRAAWTRMDRDQDRGPRLCHLQLRRPAVPASCRWSRESRAVSGRLTPQRFSCAERVSCVQASSDHRLVTAMNVRRSLTMGSLLVLAAVSAHAQSEKSVIEEIRKVDRERIQAQVSADAAALDRIYAEDFIGVGPSGTVRWKIEVLSDF